MIFRPEAVEHAWREPEEEPIRVDPAWLRWCYLALLVLVVAGLVAVATVRVGVGGDRSVRIVEIFLPRDA